MEKVLGTDISHWEDNPSTPQRIDYKKMKSAGAEFCIFKATQGSKFVDVVFKEDWNRAKEAGLVLGAYHFLDWSADGDKQADHFIKTIGNRKLDFPPVVDYEFRTDSLTPKQMMDELWGFVYRIESVMGIVPMIYTGPSFWKTYGSTASIWASYPLWIANYEVTKPIIPAPWTEYTIWQYTPSGNGSTYGVEALGIDLNYFNGDLNDLYMFVGWESTPTPVEPTDKEKLNMLWDAHPELHK